MENDYGTALENYDSEYISEEYTDEESQEYYGEPAQVEAQYQQPQQAQTQVTAAPSQVYAQPTQVVTQPIYTQPVIAQPIYTQPIYTQPIIMQTIEPAEPEYQSEALCPAEPVYPVYPTQNYLPADELKAEKWQAPPVLVFFALLLCFPVGLVLLLFFTKWGVFPKIFLTFFTLICIWFAYEIFAFYSGFDLPSLLNSIL